MKKQKYAVFTVGDKRQLLTIDELIKAIKIAAKEDKQKDYIFSFSFVEMTETEAKHEKEFYDTLNK